MLEIDSLKHGICYIFSLFCFVLYEVVEDVRWSLVAKRRTCGGDPIRKG